MLTVSSSVDIRIGDRFADHRFVDDHLIPDPFHSRLVLFTTGLFNDW